MKILFITRKYPPSTGGMELFAYDLSNALASKVKLKLIKWGGSGRIWAVATALPYLYIRSIWALLAGGVDVIHVQDGLLAPLGCVLSKLFNKPFVVVIHGLDITYQKWLYRLVVLPAVRRADKVVCISRAAAEQAILRGVSSSKIQVIPLAVNDKLYGTSNRTNLIKLLKIPTPDNILLTVGRLERRKGVAWFISNVLPDLVALYTDLIYLVVGEGRERQNIEAAIRQKGMEQHVHLLGRVGADLLAAAYNAADVFVMPNIFVPGDMEGFGLVVLEASVCALPVVASDIEGVKDAVADGKNGILVKVGETAAFLDKITRLLDDKSYARQFGEKSRRYTLNNYEWDKLAERYIEEYLLLLAPTA